MHTAHYNMHTAHYNKQTTHSNLKLHIKTSTLHITTYTLHIIAYKLHITTCLSTLPRANNHITTWKLHITTGKLHNTTYILHITIYPMPPMQVGLVLDSLDDIHCLTEAKQKEEVRMGWQERGDKNTSPGLSHLHTGRRAAPHTSQPLRPDQHKLLQAIQVFFMKACTGHSKFDFQSLSFLALTV